MVVVKKAFVPNKTQQLNLSVRVTACRAQNLGPVDPSLLRPQIVEANANPSKLDYPHIRETMAALQNKQAHLTSRISQVTTELHTLLSEEAETKKTYEGYRALLAPTRRLPPELLSLIFLLSLPPERFVRPVQTDTPITLLCVCRLWRSIALATPDLWASIRVTHRVFNRASRPLDVSKYIDAIVAPAMNSWLERAGILPVSIAVEGLRMKQSILDILIRFSHRCVHIELKRILSWFALEIPVNQGFPLLETLYIHSSVGDIVQFSAISLHSPRLCSIFWEDATAYGPDESLTLPTLPWSQLKRLTLGSGLVMHVAEGMVLNLLELCSTLEFGEFSLRKVPVPAKTPVNLPSLTQLVLHTEHSVNDHSGFLEHLLLPNLRVLKCNHGALSAFPLVKFSLSSYLKLETLCLHGVFPVSLEQCLQVLGPSLKFLSIVHQIPVVSGELLDRLTAAPAFRHSIEFNRKPCLCPKLERLHLVGCVAKIPGALAKMVQSRLLVNSERPPDVALLKIIGVHRAEMDLESLRNLKKHGLEVLDSNGGFLCTL